MKFRQKLPEHSCFCTCGCNELVLIVPKEKTGSGIEERYTIAYQKDFIGLILALAGKMPKIEQPIGMSLPHSYDEPSDMGIRFALCLIQQALQSKQKGEKDECCT